MKIQAWHILWRKLFKRKGRMWSYEWLPGEDRFSSFSDWQISHRPSIDARWHLNALLADGLTSDGWPGFCTLCEQPVSFRLPSLASGNSPNLREELICEICGINARCRAGLTLAQQAMAKPHSQVYITEQASPAFAWLQSRHRNAVGSEFEPDPWARKRLGAYLWRLGGRGQIRFEDVTALTLGDETMDAVVSFDVLEHVPDYRQSLREFARVTKPGGVLVLTAPFVQDCAQTITRARLREDGQVEHLLEPEYHGDPLGDGVLCWYHFGWDLLDDARRAGFREAQMVMPWAPSFGLFSGLWTLVASK